MLKIVLTNYLSRNLDNYITEGEELKGKRKLQTVELGAILLYKTHPILFAQVFRRAVKLTVRDFRHALR